MKINTVPVLALAGMALAAPWACFAAVPSSVAAHNCAQALAARLNAHLAGVNEQPNFEQPITLGSSTDQYILTARAANGTRTRPMPMPMPMVCTVDREGQVLSLHRPAATDTIPLIDAGP